MLFDIQVHMFVTRLIQRDLRENNETLHSTQLKLLCVTHHWSYIRKLTFSLPSSEKVRGQSQPLWCCLARGYFSRASAPHHEGLNLHPWAKLLPKMYSDDSHMMNIYIGYLFCSIQPWTLLPFDLLLFILMLLLWLLKSVFNAVLICNIRARQNSASLVTDFTSSTICPLFFPVSVTAPDAELSRAFEAFQLLQGGRAEADCSSAQC